MTAIECVRMSLGPPDGSGRPSPVPIPGSEFVLAVDTVIAAVGQAPEIGFLPHQASLDRKGHDRDRRLSGATAAPGVFAGGDASGGRAFVADAIASGKMGALAIYCYIEGKDADRE